MQKLQQNHSLLRSSEINSGNPSFCHGGPGMLQPEKGRQPEVVFFGITTMLLAVVGVKFQNSSENPFDSHPATIILIVIALLIYGFAAAWTRPNTSDREQQQIPMWRIIYYFDRLLDSLSLITYVVCPACIVSLLIPCGPKWNVYVACASTLCFGVAVWAILHNFAPSCVERLKLCMGLTGSRGLTGSSGGSEKNDGVSNCGNDGRNRIAEPNGSPVCGSSMVSENQSSSLQGGTSSSDTGSHSGHFKAEQSQLKHTCEHGVPSHQTDHSTQANGKTANTGNAVSPHIIQSSPNKGTESEAHPDPKEAHSIPKPIEGSQRSGAQYPLPFTNAPCFNKLAPFDHPLDV